MFDVHNDLKQQPFEIGKTKRPVLNVCCGAYWRVPRVHLLPSAIDGQGSLKSMLAILVRTLFPVLAATLVSACAVSSVSDIAGNKLPAPAVAPQPVALNPKETVTQPDQAADQDAVRSVALSFTSAADPASQGYAIGPRDTLDITVFQAPELSKTYQVSERGTIAFPLAGDVDAGGKTTHELEQELRKKLGTNYVRNPQVSVLLKENFSQRVTVEGSVRKPGGVPIPGGGLTLLQAIAEAQGFDDAASATVVVFRHENGKRLAGRYDVSSIRDGGAEDPQLQAGDVIVVPNSQWKEGLNIFSKLAPLGTMATYLALAL